MSPFVVREVEVNDRLNWEPLWQAYQSPSRKIPDEVTNVTWQRFFDELEPVHALVAAEGEALIGFVHYLFHRSTAQLAPICYLQDMYVEDGSRRRGVARSLIHNVCLRAKTLGASRVYWNTGKNNAAARALYGQVATLTGFVQYRIDL